jgi:flagellar export protein FliJ
MTYRFETLLRLRKNTENLEQKEMAQAQHRLLARQKQLQDMKTTGEEHGKELQTRLQQTLSGTILGLYDWYFQSLGTRAVVQEHLITESGRQVEAQRTQLVEAMKKRRVLEILKDRELLNARRKMTKEEIAFQDEVAATRWQMKKA